jgi:hypothetical protein
MRRADPDLSKHAQRQRASRYGCPLLVLAVRATTKCGTIHTCKLTGRAFGCRRLRARLHGRSSRCSPRSTSSVHHAVARPRRTGTRDTTSSPTSTDASARAVDSHARRHLFDALAAYSARPSRPDLSFRPYPVARSGLPDRLIGAKRRVQWLVNLRSISAT